MSEEHSVDDETLADEALADEAPADLMRTDQTFAQDVSALPGERSAEETQLSAAIEAICMVADQPVPSTLLAEVLEVSASKIDEMCSALTAQYEADKRGFVLANVAGGWRFQSHSDQAAYVERFVLDGQSSKLSGAALETLAIVAYKQPISRAQIAAVRGVNVDGVLKTLQQRGYVTELGQDTGPGQAMFFGTTALFLEKLGIATLDDLPPLADFIPDASLVEMLEQGLRPSSVVDVRDGDDDDMALAAADQAGDDLREMLQDELQPGEDTSAEDLTEEPTAVVPVGGGDEPSS